MFCSRCGNQLPEGSVVCNYCGQIQDSGRQMTGNQRGAGIDNIFSALVHERTPGTIAEFVFWCITCVVVLLSLIVSIMSNGSIVWIFLMLFSIGYGVIAAFRLKPILLLYNVGVFNLLLGIMHFAVFVSQGAVSHYWTGYYDYSYSAFNIVLFVLTVLLALAVVVCACVQFFSKVDLGNTLTILVIVNTGVSILLHIMMYALPYTGEDASNINSMAREYMGYRSYWFGTICLWIMLIVIMLFYIFFFWGAIDNSRDKIIGQNKNSRPGSGVQAPFNPGLHGISGAYAGQTILLRGRTLTIGSDPQMMVVLQTPNVGSRHCAIRYNNQNGIYEIFDNSTNGVYLKSGGALRKGVYNPVRRGEIIIIGNREQQFILL
ncbi:MAG: FHA domain-containing protein [Lachnospiraceae bacterium]|nr:FHA domain-containing protein [Lachnospiraceae bacterium]